MIITNIELENYRGVKNRQSIPLSNFSSIVGKNDSGKSILLNAIACFLDPKNYRIVESDFNDDKKEILITCSFYDENPRMMLEKKVKSIIKKNDGLDSFLDDVLFDNSVIIQKNISKAGNTFDKISLLIKDFDDSDFSRLYEKSDDDLKQLLVKYSVVVPAHGKGRNSRMEKIEYLKEYCNENKIKIIKIWVEDVYKISGLLPGVELFVSDYGLEADTKFKTNSVSEIQDFFKEETKDEHMRLSGIEKDIRNEMNKEAESIKIYMQDYTHSLIKVVIEPDIKWSKVIDGVDVSFQFKGDYKPIPMSHKGSGYRRLFMVARFRYIAEKNKGSNVIYLIEEPETFLHPSAQNDLLNSLKKLSESNQVVITTHSPIFAGSINHEAIILCKKSNQSIYEHTTEENKNDFIKSIIDELGVKPYYNMRDSFEKIFFAESQNDIDFYDLISEKIIGKKISDDSRLLCLPFGGSSIDSFVNIEYFTKSHRNLYLIIDSDKHLDQKKQNKQIERIKDFNNRVRGEGYILQKANIENYYHPRALERVYGLENNTIDYFNDSENVGKKIKKICEENTIQVKEKNNFDIFKEMSKKEWEEIVESKLVDFLKSINHYDEK